MSTPNTQTTTNSNPPATVSTGMGGLCLATGSEGFVTAALCDLQEVFNDMNYQDLLQGEEMAVTTQDAVEAGAENTREEGEEMFFADLAQGGSAIAGSFVSLGTMAYGEFGDSSRAELEQVKQQKQGIENTKKALPEEHRVGVNEKVGLPKEEPVQGPKTDQETADEAKAEADHKKKVQEKVDDLKKQQKFVGPDDKALTVSTEDQELFDCMDQKTQVPEVKDALDKQYDKAIEQEQSIIKQHSERVNTFTGIGKAFEGIFNGAGSVGAGIAKKAAAEYRAEGQLATSAAQSMGSIMAQLLKTANDALSQAQQTIQNMATISNGNKYNH